MCRDQTGDSDGSSETAIFQSKHCHSAWAQLSSSHHNAQKLSDHCSCAAILTAVISEEVHYHFHVRFFFGFEAHKMQHVAVRWSAQIHSDVGHRHTDLDPTQPD